MKCRHESFTSLVRVSETEQKRLLATVQIKCSQCGEQFRFFGLPKKLDLMGAAVSSDEMEARLAIGTDETLAEYYRVATGVDISKLKPDRTESTEQIVRKTKYEPAPERTLRNG